jgi:eukaryotic-like serine/threonine-protein kinase
MNESSTDASEEPERSTAYAGEQVVTGDYQGAASGAPAEVLAPAHSTLLQERKAQRGRFTLLKLHAQGGLGQVSLARDEKLHRQVAIKEIRADRGHDAVMRQRFLIEAEVTGQLEHPGVVPVYALEEDADGQPYYAMRFIEGRTLAEAIRVYHDAPTALVFRDLLKRFTDVCHTIAYAHSRKVIHRDLKPANIILGEFGETLVVDWGLAKRLGESKSEEGEPADVKEAALANTSSDFLTEAGQVLGTPKYMAPEQAQGDASELGPATDIYALGAILYELLTGRPPYLGKSSHEVLAQVRKGPAVPPSGINSAVPRALEAICQKAMAWRPKDRYLSAECLAQDVNNWLAGERVDAWKEPWHVGMGRYLRRRKTVVAVLAALAVVIPTAAVIGFWFVAQEQARAEINRRTAEVKENTAAQVTDYLVRIFQSADPVGLDAMGFRGSGERSEEQTARRMLDRGAQLVRRELHDQPTVRAGLLDAMGNSYRNLGAWDEARDLLLEGFQLRRVDLGDDHADTVTSLQSLAHLARDRGDYPEADRQYREVIRRREELYGADNLRVAETKFYLAWMTFNRPLSTDGPQFNEAMLAEAERLLVEVLNVRERHLPANHRDIGFTLAALASIKLSQPKQELAVLAYAARAAEVFRQSDQDTVLGNALVELLTAEQHRKARRYDQAEAGYLRVLDLCRRHLGKGHPLVLIQMGNLAGLYRQKGDLPKTIKIGWEMLELIRPTPSFRSQPVIVDAMMQFADIIQQRDPAEGESLYREALQYARERPHGNEKNLSVLEKRLQKWEGAGKPTK